VRAAHVNRAREEEWLLIELPKGEAEPTRYFPSTLPPDISFRQLAAPVDMRWRIERDYLELKQDLGPGHYKGRNWRGFHYHASLRITVYGFLMLERPRGSKKSPPDSKHLPHPTASSRVGLGRMQRHIPWSINTTRFRLSPAIARHLPQWPCCGKPACE
jgi:SRSO17 transposase